MSTHYLLLTLAACIFCGTFLLVSKDTPMVGIVCVPVCV